MVARKKNSRAGKYIILNHNHIYRTSYSHLSRYAKGLRVGKKIKQGEVIGFVGSTGAATGAHLDFALKKHGKRINPEQLKFMGGRNISEKLRDRFSRIAQDYMKALDGRNNLIRAVSGDIIEPEDKNNRIKAF